AHVLLALLDLDIFQRSRRMVYCLLERRLHGKSRKALEAGCSCMRNFILVGYGIRSNCRQPLRPRSETTDPLAVRITACLMWILIVLAKQHTNFVHYGAVRHRSGNFKLLPNDSFSGDK